MKHVDASAFVPQPAPGRDIPRERPLRLWPRILAGLVLSALLVAGCGGWAAWAMLEGAVVAAGTVKVDQNLKEVQHRDGGIVKTLAVRQGDQVKEGQVLATLDDVQIKAEHLIVRAQMVESLGRRARLVAERDNLPSVEFPADMHALFPSTAGAVIHGEAGCSPATRPRATARRSSSSSASARPAKRSGAWRPALPPKRRRSGSSAPSARSCSRCLTERS